jgi:hypothetical protein
MPTFTSAAAATLLEPTAVPAQAQTWRGLLLLLQLLLLLLLTSNT